MMNELNFIIEVKKG